MVRSKAAQDAAAAQNLRRPNHPNLVNIKDAFICTGTLYVIYERMDISIERLTSYHISTMGEKHIATICREVSMES